MQVIDLNFRYKGGRDYVHGTDMYNTIVERISAANPEVAGGTFTMTIHDIVRGQCQLVYSDWTAQALKPENSKVEFSFASGATRIIGWLVETAEAVTERYEYPESEIIQKCFVDGKTVKIDSETPYSAIEVLVAINKHLHLSVLQNAVGKWFFTRLELERLLRPEDASRFQLELVKNMHNRLTKSEILSDGRRIGHIFFSIVKL